MNISTLRPGLLVSLSCTVSGNVTYRKTNQETVLDADGMSVVTWTTERTITDIAEHNAGTKARADARNAVTAACTHSAFGLLCPEANADKLESAIAKAREIAARFNDTAKLSRLNVYVITGRIAPDDVEAVRAINAQIRQLMATMETGIQNLDVTAVRKAANEARALGGMLTADAESRVAEAVKAARQAARKISKAGEQAAIAIDSETLARIGKARVSFLDLGDTVEIDAPVIPGRAVDLAPADDSSDVPPVVLQSAPYDMES